MSRVGWASRPPIRASRLNHPEKSPPPAVILQMPRRMRGKAGGTPTLPETFWNLARNIPFSSITSSKTRLEVDVDCIADGETVVIGAIMEHIEEAGIHSGDSSCVIPPFSLK